MVPVLFRLGENMNPDPQSRRSYSSQRAVALGYPAPPSHLPLSEAHAPLRDPQRVVERGACLSAVMSSCFGFNGQTSWRWLHRNHAELQLTDEERKLLATRKPDRSSLARELETRVEALWALSWAIGLVSRLDWAHYCGNQLRELWPDPTRDEPLTKVRSRAALRHRAVLQAEEDLAYCLHWAVVDAEIRRAPSPGSVRPYVIRERRHALSWLLNTAPWDGVPMDT